MVQRYWKRSKGGYPRRPKETLTTDEVIKILAMINDLQDMCIFGLCYFQALRVGEVVGTYFKDRNGVIHSHPCMQRDQLDFQRKILFIPKKWRKNKVSLTIPLVPRLASLLKAYTESLPADKPLFTRNRSQCWLRLQKYAELAGITKAVGVHSLRHARAQAVYDATGELSMVQGTLGHRDLATSSIYARPKLEKIAEVLNEIDKA